VPVLADLKPSGKYVMAELVKIGGTPADEDAARRRHAPRRLPDRHRPHHGREPQGRRPYPAGQEVIRPLDNPIKKDSHLVILRGNLAPGGAVAKISGKEGLAFQGTSRAFDSEEEALKAHPRRQSRRAT
jgi:dihydroxy-acid dehydratase